MASLSPQQQQELALSAAYEDDTPTPLGWRRKLIPHIGKGLVPARTDVIFIAPNGEEFKTKAQLQRCLKSNEGSPSLSEFIWITDETPRRSSRSASKRSKSPPKSVNKKKHVAEIPLEESKATKHKHIEREDVVEEPTGDKSTHSRKTGKVAPIDSKDDLDGALISSPPTSNAKDSKKKPIKHTKKKKDTQISTQPTEVSSNVHMSANDNRAHMSEKHENGKDEAVEESGNERIMEENGEETMECLISLETTKKVPVMTKSIEIEEQADGKDKDMDNVHDEHMDNQAGSKDADGDCDGTTTSVLGSDLSAEGMEAESEIFDSEKKERPLCEEDAGHHVEKDDNNTPRDSAKDALMHQENHLIEAAK